jgi:lysyl-tRNA synthetase class 2
MNSEFIRERSKTVKQIRQFFDERGYTEMQTPRLVGLPGQEPHLEPLWSEIKEADGTAHRGALITSPEYAMKRLLAAGFDKIYDLGPCFRNGEPWDGSHDTEFLMLEWYRKGISIHELMDETEEMTRSILPDLPKFRRITVEQAMKEYAGVELGAL